MSVSPVAKVLMSASAFSIWLCSGWRGAVCGVLFFVGASEAVLLEPLPVRIVLLLARECVRERFFHFEQPPWGFGLISFNSCITIIQ